MSIKSAIYKKLSTLGEYIEPEMPGRKLSREIRISAERRGEEALNQYKTLRTRRTVKEMLEKMKKIREGI